MSAPALSLRGLTRRFAGVTAVDRLTFDVAPGELFGIVGPDGAGKTTTLRILAGTLALYLVVSHSADLVTWFGPDGILSVDTTMELNPTAPYDISRVRVSHSANRVSKAVLVSAVEALSALAVGASFTGSTVTVTVAVSVPPLPSEMV